MTKDEALKLALEALDIVNPNEFSQADPEGKIDKAIASIKEALTQQEQEPVAWRLLDEDPANNGDDRWAYYDKSDFQNGFDPTKLGLEPLYTSPPQRKPLTDEQRREVYKKAEAQLYTVPNKPWLDALIEQTEAAHGIKGDA